MILVHKLFLFIGSPMYILQIKLKNLKKVLRKSNKEVFGDIATNDHIC